MELGGGRGELLHDECEEVEGHISDFGGNALDSVTELLHPVGDDVAVNVLKHLRCRLDEVEDVEARDESRVDGVPSSAWGSHSGNVLKILHHLLLEVLVTVIDETVGEEGQKERNRLLRSVRVDLGHVHVVDKNDEFLARSRTIDRTRPLVNVRFDVVLNVFRGCTGGHVDGQAGELLGWESGRVLVDGQGLGSSTLSNEKDRLERGKLHEHVRVQDTLSCGHDDVVEVEGRGLHVLVDPGGPVEPPVLVNVIVKVIKDLVGETLRRVVLDKFVELDTTVGDELSSNRPYQAVNVNIFNV
mmetsp:Transcript_4967/g.9913  ORF Transcript_4967/g.9913 Transcript_4967/m.9913 type:complete len:300 (-) Transcript_4967:7498-8397(-)